MLSLHSTTTRKELGWMPPNPPRFVTTSDQTPGPGSALYHCYTCEDSEVVLHEGDKAPECRKCGRPVTWELRRRLNR